MIIRAVTIEQRLFARKKRKRVLQHKDGIRKILTVILPAQEATGGQPLAPILGQVQILVSDFVDKFNDTSSLYPAGFPLNVEISIHWDKTYSFLFRPIPFTHFVFDFVFVLPVYSVYSNLTDFISCIYINDFFKLFRLFKSHFNFNHIGDFQIFNSIKSLMSSLQIHISFISKIDFVSALTNIVNNDLYINLYFFAISELYMSSFSGCSKYLNSEVIEDSGIQSEKVVLEKKKLKKKNKRKYVI